MKEALRERVARSTLALALAAGGSALAGCTPNSELDRPPRPIPRCHDKPSAQPKSAKGPLLNLATIRTHLQKPPTAQYNQLTDATVLITEKRQGGRVHQALGVIVNGKVVTAAHAVDKNDMNALTVTTANGDKMSVTNACYYIQEKGELRGLNELKPNPSEGVLDSDIAILRTSARLGPGVPLSKKKGFAAGTQVLFTGSPDLAPATVAATQPEPSIYRGTTIARHGRPESMELFLTGLDGPNSYVIPGNSGGGVMMSDGTLGCVIHARVLPENTPAALKVYGYNHVPDSNLGLGICTPAWLIDKAMQSAVFQN